MTRRPPASPPPGRDPADSADQVDIVGPADSNNFAVGSVAGRILRLAVPMTLAHLINLLYSIVDRIWLGRWQAEGAMALAGVGLSFHVVAVISSISRLAAPGSVPLFNIARGGGDRERAARIMGNAFSTLLILSVVLTAAGLVFRRPILFLVGASDDTIRYAEDYLSIYLCGTVFAMCGLGMNGFINAQGFGRVGMLTVLLGAIVNIVLDPILIFGLGLGIRGAAIATVFAQGCSALWAISFLRGNKPVIPIRAEWMRLDPRILSRSLALGVAGFTMAMTNSIVGTFYNVALRDLGGDLYVSVMVIVHSIQEIVQLPGGGLSEAAQPVMSYNYGAGRNDRVRRAMRFISAVSVSIYVVLWAGVLLFPEALIRVFSSDPELVRVGVGAVRAYFLVFVLMAFQGLGQAGYVSLGLTKHAVFFSVLRKGVIVAPCILLLGYGLGLGTLGVFYAEPVSHVLGSVTCYVVFMLTIYRKRLVDKPPASL
jgi:putative MATE family efflux protein